VTVLLEYLDRAFLYVVAFYFISNSLNFDPILFFLLDNHSNFQLIPPDGLSDRGWNLCILITQKSIVQFLPRLDLASYLCYL